MFVCEVRSFTVSLMKLVHRYASVPFGCDIPQPYVRECCDFRTGDRRPTEVVWIIEVGNEEPANLPDIVQIEVVRSCAHSQKPEAPQRNSTI